MTLSILTWLHESDIKDLLHLRVVGGHVEHYLLLLLLLLAIVVVADVALLDAGDVDRDEILADLGPLDAARAGRGHVEDLGPQPANGNRTESKTNHEEVEAESKTKR